ncbi:MAG: spermine/spermidine synthase domain-containing protein [Gammaproteobacteria bacterium]
MRKYNALLIHQQHDDDGVLEIVEAGGVRSLHFGSLSKQSSMALSAPDELQLSYCRAMMSWRLFLDRFDDALLIGLGGGSLAKYLLQHFPRGNIEAFETRADVVRIARSFFHLPDDPRLNVHIGDGGEYIRQTARGGQTRYDLLLIDAYNHDAMSASVDGPTFFDSCRELLHPHGVMAINLWGADNPGYDRSAEYISRCFEEKALFMPVRGRDNVIALGFASAVPKFGLQHLRRKAEILEKHSQIEYPAFLKALTQHNVRALKRVIQ